MHVNLGRRAHLMTIDRKSAEGKGRGALSMCISAAMPTARAEQRRSRSLQEGQLGLISTWPETRNQNLR